MLFVVSFGNHSAKKGEYWVYERFWYGIIVVPGKRPIPKSEKCNPSLENLGTPISTRDLKGSCRPVVYLYHTLWWKVISHACVRGNMTAQRYFNVH